MLPEGSSGTSEPDGYIEVINGWGAEDRAGNEA
jgi:hypothetical protein